MALSADKKAMLKKWAAAGDIMALEALALEASGRAGFVSLGTPAAPAVAVHTAIAGTTSVDPVTTALTSPAQPRNLAVVFATDWDGGDAVVTGTDQYGTVISETFTGASNVTVVGNKIFKTVTSIAHTVVGADPATYTVQTGSKLGLMNNATDAYAMGLVDGVPEKAVLDPTYDSVLFTTAPNGAKVFVLLCNL